MCNAFTWRLPLLMWKCCEDAEWVQKSLKQERFPIRPAAAHMFGADLVEATDGIKQIILLFGYSCSYLWLISSILLKLNAVQSISTRVFDCWEAVVWVTDWISTTDVVINALRLKWMHFSRGIYTNRYQGIIKWSNGVHQDYCICIHVNTHVKWYAWCWT